MPLVESKYSGKFLPEVTLGATVSQDDTLCRISVWGIKLGIRCPCDGTVETIFPQPGDDVKRGDSLFSITAPAQAPPSGGAIVADAPLTGGTNGTGT